MEVRVGTMREGPSSECGAKSRISLQILHIVWPGIHYLHQDFIPNTSYYTCSSSHFRNSSFILCDSWTHSLTLPGFVLSLQWLHQLLTLWCNQQGWGLKYKTPVNQVDYIVGVLENLLVLKTAFKQRPVDEGMQLSKFKWINLSHLHMQQAVGKRKSILHGSLTVIGFQCTLTF